ncbi:MAG: alkaline phosphatase family protein [Firmicutes bacterium]|nr:alkaline phosphatase family protein [Bacillota bacterium]
MSLLFVFADGVGYAPCGPRNPLWSPGLPRLEALAGWRLCGAETEWGLVHRSEDGRAAVALLDATLGVDGLPQSGTGQAALFGGFNAAKLEGRHVPAFPTRAIREALEGQNLFKAVHARGGRAVFLNAYRTAFFEGERPRHARLSCTTAAYAAIGLPFRTVDDLNAGRAVAFDITGARLREVEPRAALRTPEEAGAVAARVALEEAELAVFEYFLTDRAGHLQDEALAAETLDALDRFLAGAWEVLAPRGGRLFLTSDHGNLEDLSVRTHTRRPVPAVALGPGAIQALAGARGIEDVPQALVAWLEHSEAH